MVICTYRFDKNIKIPCIGDVMKPYVNHILIKKTKKLLKDQVNIIVNINNDLKIKHTISDLDIGQRIYRDKTKICTLYHLKIIHF